MVQSVIVNQAFASGMPGDFARAGSQDSFGAFLKSVIPLLNVPARIVHYVPNDNNYVGVNAAGNFAGMIGSAKDSYRATLQGGSSISNQEQIQVVVSGYVFVTLPGAAAEGDWVYYAKATGELLTAAPGVVPPADSLRLPGSRVSGENVTAAGIAEIFFDIAGSTVVPVA